MVWLNVGRRERRLLFLLRERDEPAGKPIAIRDAVCREFKIDYKPYTLKNRQKEAFCEERYVRRAFERLFKKGFVVPVRALRDGFSLIPSDDVVDFDYCILTKEGRLVAERLKQQTQGLKVEEEVEAVRRVLVQFRSLGYVYVTALQVRDFLWQDLQEKFVSREEFDKYWHNTKIGLRLQKYRVGRARVSKRDTHRKYCLTLMTLPINDDI
ncbi:MAG: hypothetical protein LBE76_05680 [Nitrososphaerota archaeon]|nr:hypothetical protein [Nitrososphaerota archaeon]